MDITTLNQVFRFVNQRLVGGNEPEPKATVVPAPRHTDVYADKRAGGTDKPAPTPQPPSPQSPARQAIAADAGYISRTVQHPTIEALLKTLVEDLPSIPEAKIPALRAQVARWRKQLTSDDKGPSVEQMQKVLTEMTAKVAAIDAKNEFSRRVRAFLAAHPTIGPALAEPRALDGDVDAALEENMARYDAAVAALRASVPEVREVVSSGSFVTFFDKDGHAVTVLTAAR